MNRSAYSAPLRQRGSLWTGPDTGWPGMRRMGVVRAPADRLERRDLSLPVHQGAGPVAAAARRREDRQPTSHGGAVRPDRPPPRCVAGRRRCRRRSRSTSEASRDQVPRGRRRAGDPEGPHQGAGISRSPDVRAVGLRSSARWHGPPRAARSTRRPRHGRHGHAPVRRQAAWHATSIPSGCASARGLRSCRRVRGSPVAGFFRSLAFLNPFALALP